MLITPFDSFTLRAVACDLQALVGGQIQEVRQPSSSLIWLAIRAHGRSYALLLSADARFARVHLTDAKPPNAPSPPPFCQALRRHVYGGFIEEVRQQGFDRVCEIDISVRIESGETVRRTLIAELTGKLSNVILTDENGIVIDALKRITNRVNRFRETLPGQPYIPPPLSTDRADPFVSPPRGDRLPTAELLVQTFAGMSPFLARELMHRAATSVEEGTTVEKLARVWRDTFEQCLECRFRPVLLRDEEGHPIGAYPTRPSHLETAVSHRAHTISLGLDAAYSASEAATRKVEQLQRLAIRTTRALQRAQKQRDACLLSIAQKDRAEQHQQTGDLLAANLWRIRPADREVIVADFYQPDAPERTIPLDPKLSPHENMEAAYRRARKARDAAEAATLRLPQLEAELAELGELGDAVESATRQDATDEEIARLDARIAASGRVEPPPAPLAPGNKIGPRFQGHRIRQYPDVEGFEILVGGSATANDYLTTRIAAPDDWWLHVRAGAGAHVVIRTHGKPESVPRSVLERAAALCAAQSAQKHSSLVPVDYTLRRYVRKPRGAKPGLVEVRNERTIEVEPA